MQPALFYGPGQQQGFMPPTAAGRAGIPFAPQQGMGVPGMQGGRPGQFAGMTGQQGGRGAPNAGQQIPPNAFGMPGQAIPFPMNQGGPMGGFPNGMTYPQAVAQVQAQLGRGVPGGRGQMQGMQGVPPQMMGLQQGMRGRDGRPQQFPVQPGRGGLGIGMPAGQMGGFPPQGRGPMIPIMGQPGMMQPGADAALTLPNLQALTSAPPTQQKQLLGEALYPKISALQHDLAGKITGMLLEMDNSELIGLYVTATQSQCTRSLGLTVTGLMMMTSFAKRLMKPLTCTTST